MPDVSFDINFFWLWVDILVLYIIHPKPRFALEP